MLGPIYVMANFSFRGLVVPATGSSFLSILLLQGDLDHPDFVSKRGASDEFT